MRGRLGWRHGTSAVVIGLVAFLAVSQLTAEPGTTERLEFESEEDLTRIFDGLNAEAAALRDEITELRIQLRLLESSAESERVRRDAVARELRQLEVLAGLVPATGPGVIVRISDPFESVTFDLVLDLIQELRNARAEAISVNGVRIGARTYVTEEGDDLSVGGTRVDPPYVVQGIGDSATLEGGLTLPGGSIDTLSSLPEVEVTVERRSEIRVPALSEPPDFERSEPVEE